MLLNEIATVTNISDAAEKRDLKNRSAERLAKMKKRRRDFKNPDEVGEKRRSTMSQADQFRDLAKQFKK